MSPNHSLDEVFICLIQYIIKDAIGKKWPPVEFNFKKQISVLSEWWLPLAV